MIPLTLNKRQIAVSLPAYLRLPETRLNIHFAYE